VNGAEVLGLDKTGTLEVGKKADIITVDLFNVNVTPVITTPFRNLVPNVVYSTTGLEVDNVIINGRLVMHDTTFTQIDPCAIMKEATKRAENIVERAEEDWTCAHSKISDYVKEGWM
jgi:5-methylthioadenosine/S-adenosylhomocysteine deaminase